MNPTRSVGQGNLYSKLSQRVTSDGTSVIKRLTSRSLMGQGLQIQIHQHIGFELHLVWHVTSNGKKSSCIERYKEITDFCDKLMSGAFEGLCECVCVHIIEWLKDKVEPCRMEISIHSHTKKCMTLCHGNRQYMRWKEESCLDVAVLYHLLT